MKALDFNPRLVLSENELSRSDFLCFDNLCCVSQLILFSEMLVLKHASVSQTGRAFLTGQQVRGPLAALEDVIPDNILAAATDNGSMLKVIFFGVGLILVDSEKPAPVKAFFDGINEVVLKMIDLIMLAAPVGVFALLAALVVETQDPQLLLALIYYGCCVVAGLAFMMAVVYPMAVKLFVGIGYGEFFRGILPAQMLAFSTSSSAATLPVTMERVEEHLGAEERSAVLRCRSVRRSTWMGRVSIKQWRPFLSLKF